MHPSAHFVLLVLTLHVTILDALFAHLGFIRHLQAQLHVYLAALVSGHLPDPPSVTFVLPVIIRSMAKILAHCVRQGFFLLKMLPRVHRVNPVHTHLPVHPSAPPVQPAHTRSSVSVPVHTVLPGFSPGQGHPYAALVPLGLRPSVDRPLVLRLVVMEVAALVKVIELRYAVF